MPVKKRELHPVNHTNHIPPAGFHTFYPIPTKQSKHETKLCGGKAHKGIKNIRPNDHYMLLCNKPNCPKGLEFSNTYSNRQKHH